MITGHWMAQALRVVAALNIADLLADGPRSAQELATASQSDGPTLNRVLRALASVGVLSSPAPGKYGLTELSQLLRSGIPGSLRDLCLAETDDPHWACMSRLTDCVRQGRSLSKETLGIGIFEWYGKHPEEGRTFSGAMDNLAKLVAKEVAENVDFSQFGLVADIGGAHGTLLAAVLNANPSAKGLLFEIPHVLDGARRYLKAQGVESRTQVEGGDFFKSIPGQADAHLLKQILHDWNDDQSVTLLKNCHHALKPGGKLYLIEMVLPDDNAPGFGQWMDLNMLAMLPGKERTLSEYKGLLEQAGLKFSRQIKTHSPFDILEASRV
jgi:SAM-dependent methyltransferase